MDTHRVTRRAGGYHVTRGLFWITAACAFALLTGCASSLADGTPEAILYCTESAGTPAVGSPSGCIERP
jgi:hypothetical protein